MDGKGVGGYSDEKDEGTDQWPGAHGLASTEAEQPPKQPRTASFPPSLEPAVEEASVVVAAAEIAVSLLEMHQSPVAAGFADLPSFLPYFKKIR